jgi:hypothetical protein
MSHDNPYTSKTDLLITMESMKLFNTEIPYSDTKPIKKGWVGGFWKESKWAWEIDLDFLSHSKNWSMNSLIIDLIFFELQLGPFEMFFAYRLRIKPPTLPEKILVSDGLPKRRDMIDSLKYAIQSENQNER